MTGPSPRLALALFSGLLAQVGVQLWLAEAAGPRLSLALSIPAGIIAALAASLGPLSALGRLEQGLRRFRQRDFAARLGERGGLGELGMAFDDLAEWLTAEQGDRAQRDQLLQTLVGAAPTAIVLYGDAGGIVYANGAARDLFFEGGELVGHNFLRMVQGAPAPLRQAVLAESDELFTVEEGGEPETYHLAKRYFDLSGEPHTLLMVHHLTREISRQEVEVWKKVIRVISHELNNSLAPISSMVHSAKLIAKSPEHAHRLGRVLDTVEERAAHLKTFLEGYARFARLPSPRPQTVAWGPFLAPLREMFPEANIPDGPASPGYFDEAQLSQVLINLLKNAAESGGAPGEVSLEIEALESDGARVSVLDRGKGMSDEVLRHALLPFYTTKERGSGLGLALSREIIEAHRGRIRLRPREGGGLVVTCTLPGREPTTAPRTHITLTGA